jgi:hypothetical protein
VDDEIRSLLRDLVSTRDAKIGEKKTNVRRAEWSHYHCMFYIDKLVKQVEAMKAKAKMVVMVEDDLQQIHQHLDDVIALLVCHKVNSQIEMYTKMDA